MKKLHLVFSLLIICPTLTFAMPTINDIKRHGILTVDQINAVHEKAKAGDAFSQADLGEAYINNSIGFLPNYPEAIRWLEKSAKQGCALAYFNLAMIYLEGEGVTRDKDEFFKYAKLGLDAYNKQLPTYTPYQRATTEYQVAEMYLWGVPGLVPQDLKKAFALFRDSAEDGFAHSVARVILMYRYGIGTKRDLTTSHQWVELLANTGDAHAEYTNGMDYLNGIGIKKDKDKALFWLQRAALKDYIPAIGTLVQLEKIGTVHINHETAVDWQNILENVSNEVLEQRMKEPASGKF